MNRTMVWLVILAAVLGAVAGYIVQSRRHGEPQQQTIATPMPAPQQEQPAADNEPLTRFPVPQSTPAENAPEEPLPTLQDSDPALLNALGRLFDPNRLGELFIVKDMINRFVVTIDNLPRAKLPLRLLPTLPVPGKFMAIEKGVGQAEINPANYRRYAGYVKFFADMDSEKVAAVYFHFYPLIQQAYQDLGYKSAYFNDRLIAAIDDLLATPEVTDPVQLVQPSVFYKYADPRLESLSSGQKILLRIGNDNAAKIKAKLRELREALTKRNVNR
jgi:hypothetical protein